MKLKEVCSKKIAVTSEVFPWAADEFHFAQLHTPPTHIRDGSHGLSAYRPASTSDECGHHRRHGGVGAVPINVNTIIDAALALAPQAAG